MTNPRLPGWLADVMEYADLLTLFCSLAFRIVLSAFANSTA